MVNKIRYKYIIETDTPVWPRHIADELMRSERFSPTLLTVTDLQSDSHVYGATYTIEGRYARPRVGGFLKLAAPST